MTDKCPQVFISRSPPDQSFRTRRDSQGYRITLNDPTEWADILEPYHHVAPPRADVRIEVEVETTRGLGTEMFGIACRSYGTPTAPGRWYDLMVGNDGAFFIAFGKGATYGILSSGYGPLPKPGTNHLRADCIGTTLTLYLNGQLVSTVMHGEAADGLSGIHVRNTERSGAEFIFRNLIVIGL